METNRECGGFCGYAGWESNQWHAPALDGDEVLMSFQRQWELIISLLEGEEEKQMEGTFVEEWGGR